MKAEGPSLDRLYSIRGDGSRRFLHPADVRGRWIRRRRIAFALLIAVFFALPLVPIGGHPAVHLDIAARRFFLFGAAFNATDVWLVVFGLAAFAFGLLFVTAWLGRAWCGWACPQTVLLESVYRALERLVEGPGEKRLRLDAASWTAGKLMRKTLKHALFIIASLVLAYGFVSLFDTSLVWTVAIAGALYFDFAWFREQLCIVVCPYGRLQSALVDRDSLVIGYDGKRGEPRGKVHAKDRGACVDCNRCVAVCPTGIDIRNGLQMECIACAQCIDACDEIMDKTQQPRGLIRYDSQRGLDGDEARHARPRLWAYGALALAALVALGLSARGHAPFEASLVRAPGPPFVIDGETIRNQLVLHLVNKGDRPAQLRIVTDAAPGEVALPARELKLEPRANLRLPLFVSVARARFAGSFTVAVTVENGEGARTRAEARFVGPPR